MGGNRYFDFDGATKEFPRRAYARIDDIEPIFLQDAKTLTFIVDAVDADWRGFEGDGPLALSAQNAPDLFAEAWRERFNGESADAHRAFAEVPLYRIEVELDRSHSWFDAFPNDEEPWFTLYLTASPTDVPVLVYSGLFAEPIRAFLHAPPSLTAPSGALSAIFSMDNWPDATVSELSDALENTTSDCAVEGLVCFDVGQGLASALVCEHGYPIYYFDVGCGSGRNAPTVPSSITFCTCESPPVILSHWDSDHWAGARKAANLQGLTWIVPRQTISTQHAFMGNDILAAGGSILVVSHGHPPMTWTKGNRQFDLRRSTGKGRNASGLALIVTHLGLGREWVLPGDAGYHVLPHPMPRDVAAMVAPHHGAHMGPSSIPFQRSRRSYSRLIYSFGPGNNHGSKKPFVQHPVDAAVLSHAKQRWAHGRWTIPPGTVVAGADVLGTASHATAHLGGAVATWQHGRLSFQHFKNCADFMPVPQA